MTTNRLKTRISGHKTHYNTLDRLQQNGVSSSDPQIAQLQDKTALLEHTIVENHRFNLENTKILDKTNKSHTLPYLEMCHIVNNSNCINRRTDTEGLNAIYAGILHKVRNMGRRNTNNVNTQENTTNTDNTHTYNVIETPLTQS